MRIAILGAGAMGSLFGGYLSLQNEVWLVDVNDERVKKLQKDGITIIKNDCNNRYHPLAVTNTSKLQGLDLVIVFVKAMNTDEALAKNKNLLNKDTYLMTLQNGSGHDAKLSNYADPDHVIIGMTQHNSSINIDGSINHGGEGETIIGRLRGDSSRIQHIANNFTACGIQTSVSDEVKEHIWKKLFLNTAASSLTGVLQVPLGYLLDNPYAYALMEQLACEAVNVANAECGDCFDLQQVMVDIKKVLANARRGYTSIYSDIKEGRRTEVDTISGSVISTAKNLGIETPHHEFLVSIIHALEDKARA